MTILIVMGVSGSGKTTLGRALAAALTWPFYEGDDLHPPANIEKMSHRQPLTDEDRLPWLKAIKQLIDELIARGQSAVITCSALKSSYRDLLKNGCDWVRFVYLRGSFTTIQSRLLHRRGHYMPADLLASQFEALEEPRNAIWVEVTQTTQQSVQQILAELALAQVTEV